MFARILAVHDGKDTSLRAFTVALDLATRYGAHLHLIYVETMPAFALADVAADGEPASREERTEVRRMKQLARFKNVALAIHHTEGRPARTIEEFADAHRFDLIVIPYSAYARFYDPMIGNVAARVVNLAERSVLVVK